MPTKRDKCINRKIYFYRIYAGSNFAGEPKPYDVKPVLEAIDELKFLPNVRYMRDEDGFEICCWVKEFCPPQKVIFGKIKRNDLPQIEHGGNLSDLAIAEESGLAECVHVMFFPENIVGIEYNYDGPRISRISDYLHLKAKNVCPQVPIFEQLLQRDVMQKLERMRTVRQFKLRVRDSLFSSIGQADEDLQKTFQIARTLGQAKEITLMLSVGHGGGTLGTKVQNIAKRLLALKDTNHDVLSGEIRGHNEVGSMETIDLLNAKIVAEKCIPRNRTRTGAPQSELVYSAIEEAYNEKKDQLLSALGVIVCPD